MAIDWLQVLQLLQQWTGIGATDLIQLGKLLKERVEQAQTEYYYENYRKGARLISEKRQQITEFLYDYYRATSTLHTEAHTIRYAGKGRHYRDLPIVTKPDFVFQHNRNLTVQSHFSDESKATPPLTERELADEVAHWQAARLSVWDEPLYTIHHIQDTARITFRLTRFLIYRATFGSVPDELALAIATHDFEEMKKRRDVLLPKRKKFLGSAESLLSFHDRLCVGGPIVLFAAKTDDGDLALILQRRSFQVSDEPGVFTVIPKAFHQPLVSAWEEVDIPSTIYRECYEELFGGEDRPGGKRHISHQFYLAECPAIAKLYNQPNHTLQPLGIIWDLLRGNYHIAYCLYVYEPEWWRHFHRQMRVNWEVHEKIEPITRASDLAALNELISRTDWAAEAYFTFVEGLRWLSGKDEKIKYIGPSLPSLDMTPIRPISI